jgi:murein DD-endopeptidase MepM/ murein hydrolase activator NlpD
MLGPLPLFLVIPPTHLPPAPSVVSPQTEGSVQNPADQAASPPPQPAVSPPETLAPEALGSRIEPRALTPPQNQGQTRLSQDTAVPTDLQTGDNWRQCKPEDFQVFQAVTLDANAVLQGLAGVDLVTQLAESGLQVPLQAPTIPAIARGNQQRVIEQRLAEIADAAEDSASSQLQTNLVHAAISFAKQGNFEAARRVIQHQAVPESVQTDVLAQVSALEAEANRQRVAQQADQIRLANQARQIRQPGTLQSSDRGSITAVQVGPLSVTQRGLGYVGTMPALNKDYYRKVLQFPGKLGKNVLMFPLPIAAPITSGVGWRSHPVLGSQRFHSGTDIGAPEGTPILAVADGKVTGADSMGGYGLAVVIEHNNGTLETLYGHMSEILVRPGEWVQQGTIIGRVGSTGLSTGPHLHFEVKQLTSEGWVLVDPGPQLVAAQAQLTQVLQGGSLQLQATLLGQAFVGAGGGAQTTNVIQALPEVVVPRVLAQAQIGSLPVARSSAIAAKPSLNVQP